MQVKVRQIDGYHFIGNSDDFDASLSIDATARVGGEGRGFQPPVLFLYSIVSGMAIHLHQSLLAAGKQAWSIEAEVECERRETAPRVFTKTTIKYVLKGTRATENEIRAAIEHAMTESCSLTVMLNQCSTVRCEYTVLDTEIDGFIEKPALSDYVMPHADVMYA